MTDLERERRIREQQERQARREQREKERERDREARIERMKDRERRRNERIKAKVTALLKSLSHQFSPALESSQSKTNFQISIMFLASPT